MEAMALDGRFVPLDELEIVAEIRRLLFHLEEMPSHFRCGDFSLNLLMHVDGYLDRDRDRMHEDLDSFLSLHQRDQKAFVLLQRSGHYGLHPLEMLGNKALMSELYNKLEELERDDADGFNVYIRAMMACQLPRPQTGSWC